jgi:phosphatidate cytidylyltransferase
LLGLRIVTGLVFGTVLTAAVLLLDTTGASLVLGALWLAGAWEWGGLARFGAAGRAAYTAALAVAMLAALYVVPRHDVSLTLAVTAAWWLIALLAVLTFPRRFSSPVAALAGVLVLLPSWSLLREVHAVVPQGPELTLTVLIVVWAADVGAYACGRRFGRIKLAPAVSPGKTWEGVTGGLLFAAVAGWAAGRGLGFELGGATLVGIAVATAAVSVVGDLTVSMFKRNVGLKDSGRILPGHGGVLDRIDSLTAAVPIFAGGLWLAGVFA